MVNSPGQILKRANPSTIQDKFLVGYQGWFTCAGDGEPISPGHHGWLHWFNYPIPDGGRPNIDVWPDVSSYSPSELFPAPGLKTKSGEQVFLFSSRNPKTVQRHFHWMAEHGVDGVFLQRFAGQCDMESGNPGIRRLRDEVGERVREAAEREGRVFAIMYDVSGVPADRIQRILEQDWVHLVHNLGVLDSPNYLREKGKPVIALWGFGFDNAGHTPTLVRAITQFFRNATPGGVYIMGGTPAHWRTAEGDADRNPGFVDVWLHEFDAISPWTVGRYSTEQEADNFAETKIKGDLALIKKQNEESSIRKIDYIPVVLPGGSGYNLSEGKWGFNDIKREGGRFLWKQIYNARRLGVRTIYGAMWDEYDEGTAFMPIVEHTRDLPVLDKHPFLALDADGYDLPSDWYMRICGFAAEGLRNERGILETFPVKELQDYWSSHPRYEEVDLSSTDFTSGSVSAKASSNAADVEPAGGETYQEWLAHQKEDKNELPPPPYSLEVDESTDPVATEAVTGVETRSAAVATTSEVPSTVVHDAPAVASVQHVAASNHVVVSPPIVNIDAHPTSGVSASQEEAYSRHSPQPGGVHHSLSPQRHSPQPSAVSQHLPSQAHPQPYQIQAPQPYSLAADQSYHPQHATAQGQVRPVMNQPDQSYHPAGGAQPPHLYGSPSQGQSPVWGQQSYPAAGGAPYPGYPTSTGYPQGYPPAGATSQGHNNAQSAQSYGGPVRQGYPPVDASLVQGYPSNHHIHNSVHHMHNQSQDSVTTLANEFGRQSISGGGAAGGRLPTPPPLHPNHPGNSGYHGGPTRLSTMQPTAGGGLPTPPPLHPNHPGNSGYPTRLSTPQPRPVPQLQNRPPSQSAHRPGVASPTISLPPSRPESSKPPLPAEHRPRWPPPEWDSDAPPVAEFSTSSGRKPTTAANSHVGAHLTRPQTVSASSYKPSQGSTLRPTVSMGNKPPPRPNSASNTTMPSTHYASSIAESTYDNSYDIYSSAGPSCMAFPSGPEYNSTYGYQGRQHASMYDPSSSGNTSMPTTMTWPGSGPEHVSPPHSQMAYGGPGLPYAESHYHGGPSFPSSGSPAGGGVHFQFPQPSSPPIPNPGYGSGAPSAPPGPYGSHSPPSAPYGSHSPPAGSWPPPTAAQYSAIQPSSNNRTSGPLGFALNAVDKVDNIAQSLFGKFTK